MRETLDAAMGGLSSHKSPIVSMPTRKTNFGSDNDYRILVTR